ADEAARGRRQEGPPCRRPLPLGNTRPDDRRLRQRSLSAGTRPERPHPGGQGRHLRHPAGAPASRKGPDGARRELSTNGRRRGVKPGDGVETYEAEAQPRLGFFTDTSVCIGCKACEVACKEWNLVPEDGLAWTGHSYDNTGELNANTWRHVAFIVQQAPDPSKQGKQGRAAASPPAGAGPTSGQSPDLLQTAVASDGLGMITKRELGSDGGMHKCTLCYDRLQDGMEPACAKACPTDSIQFGPLDELVERARERCGDLVEAGVSEARLYLADENDGIGGAGAFFLLLDEPEVYGLPPQPVVPTKNLRTIWGAAAVAAGALAVGVAAAFLGGDE